MRDCYRHTLFASAGKECVNVHSSFQKEKYFCPLYLAIGVNNLPFNMAKEAICSTSYESAAEVIREHYSVKIGTANVRFVTDYVGSVVYDVENRSDTARAAHAVKIDKTKKHRCIDDVLYL